jgi:hypothetical protein
LLDFFKQKFQQDALHWQSVHLSARCFLNSIVHPFFCCLVSSITIERSTRTGTRINENHSFDYFHRNVIYARIPQSEKKFPTGAGKKSHVAVIAVTNSHTIPTELCMHELASQEEIVHDINIRFP